MLSLGRGFYGFFFASQEDMRTVWAAGTVSLKPGVLRLFEWTKDFNLHTQRQIHTQVWIRLWELPQEYWMERTLYEIAGAVGTQLLIDNVTRNRLYGHYARLLIWIFRSIFIMRRWLNGRVLLSPLLLNMKVSQTFALTVKVLVTTLLFVQGNKYVKKIEEHVTSRKNAEKE